MFGRAQVPLDLVSGEPGRLRTLHELLHPLHLVQEGDDPVPEVMVPASLPESGGRAGDGPHRYAGQGAPAQVREDGTAHEKREPASRCSNQDRSQHQDLDRSDPGTAVRRVNPAMVSDSRLRTKKTGRSEPEEDTTSVPGGGVGPTHGGTGRWGLSGGPGGGKLCRFRKILSEGRSRGRVGGAPALTLSGAPRRKPRRARSSPGALPGRGPASFPA
jgi:hypothetical protein